MIATVIGLALSVTSSHMVLANGSAGIVVVSPTAGYGQNQVIAVQRIAARFEQQTSLPELRQVVVTRNGGEDTLRNLCPMDADGSKVVYVDAATTHDLRPGDFYKATILLSVYDCQTKRIVSVTVQAPVIGAKGWEDPLIAAGYRSIEASVIDAILQKGKQDTGESSQRSSQYH